MNALASALLRGVDPVALAADLELDLDPWQAEVLRSDADALLNGARQTGKSTVCALKVLHKALYVPNSLSLLVAPSLRQSVEVFHTTLGLYKQLGRPVDAESENTMTLSLGNGSRILALPGSESTLRGFGSVALLVIDEAARVPDEVYHSVSPMLAVSRGAKVAISTPNGKRGWWWNAWAAGGERWSRYTVRASECERISADYLEEARREMPDWMFAQEFECAFTDSGRQAFAGADIEAAFDEGVQQWNVCS